MTSGAEASKFEARTADWLSVDEARRRVFRAADLLPPEVVTLHDAIGRALAEDIVASATLPPWDNSAMDGYAVRSDDIAGATPESPVTLPVEGVVHAGTTRGEPLRPGTAIRIMTGAPIPDGADSVVRVEDTDRESVAGIVRIDRDRDSGRHIRAAGQDMKAGTTLLSAGHSVTPGVVGVLAAAGQASLPVRRIPRVALLPTGDELRRIDEYEQVRAGRGVPESNGTMLGAMAEASGAEAIDLGIAADREDDLRRRIVAAESADVLVTIGGASMGEADLVKRVLDDLSFETDFWRVRMRPGSPISFGWLPRGDRRQAVFGLPGNPSSAFVTFELFVRPYLLRLAGHDRIERRRVPCIAAERISTPADLTYFQRVRLESSDDGLRAWLTGPQVSGLVSGLARADGLAIVAPDRASVEVGEMVPVLLLDTGPAAERYGVG